MMRLAGTAVLCMFLTAAAADEPPAYPIDERFRDLEIKLSENAKACVEHSDAGGPYCERSERNKLERRFQFRGTREYVRQYYLPQDTKELLTTRDELRDQQKAARSQKDYWVDSPRPPGELTKEILSFELNLVDKELENRKRKGRNAIRDATRDLKRVLN